MATRWHPGSREVPHGTPWSTAQRFMNRDNQPSLFWHIWLNISLYNEWPPHHQWLLGPGCQLIFELRDLYLQRHQSRILLLAQVILNQNTGRSQGHSVWLNHPDSTTLVDASTASTPNYIAVCYGAGVYQLGSSLPGSTPWKWISGHFGRPAVAYHEFSPSIRLGHTGQAPSGKQTWQHITV